MRLVTKYEDGNVVQRALNAAGNYWDSLKIGLKSQQREWLQMNMGIR